jgi:hypothetical protein
MSSRPDMGSATEIEQTLLHLKGLVFARAILEGRGASALELSEHRRKSSTNDVTWPNSSEISGLS